MSLRSRVAKATGSSVPLRSAGANVAQSILGHGSCERRSGNCEEIRQLPPSFTAIRRRINILTVYSEYSTAQSFITAPSHESTLINVRNELRPFFWPPSRTSQLWSAARVLIIPLFLGVREAGLSWKLLTLHHTTNRRTNPPQPSTCNLS